MKENMFVVSECGNSPEDAWERAQALASFENQAEPQENVGVLYKNGIKVIGKVKHGATTLEARNNAHNILKNHKEITFDNPKALCIDAGGGEYYFIGKSKIDK